VPLDIRKKELDSVSVIKKEESWPGAWGAQVEAKRPY